MTMAISLKEKTTALLHPQAARERQVVVLRSLVRAGELTAAKARQALARPLPLQGAVLPPFPRAAVEPGPPLAWPDAAPGAALLLLGGLLLATRRRTPGRRLRALGPGAAVAAARTRGRPQLVPDDVGACFDSQRILR